MNSAKNHRMTRMTEEMYAKVVRFMLFCIVGKLLLAGLPIGNINMLHVTYLY